MVSIDFWNTLVETSVGSKKRRKARVYALREVAKQHTIDLTTEAIDNVLQATSKWFDQIWINYQRTPTSIHLAFHILEQLKIPIRPNEHHYLVTVFEESFWESPPTISDNAKEVIPLLAEKYPLALISDTMYAPGRVIRYYLEKENISKYFKCFVFSDETGFSKPNPKAYYQALEQTQSQAAQSFHIGDLIETDILGAQNVGINAILFTEYSQLNYDDDPRPNHICSNWEDVKKLLLS